MRLKIVLNNRIIKKNHFIKSYASYKTNDLSPGNKRQTGIGIGECEYQNRFRASFLLRLSRWLCMLDTSLLKSPRSGSLLCRCDSCSFHAW